MTTGISITINIPGLGDAAGTASVGGITLDTGGAPPPEIDDATAADTTAEGDAPPPAEFAGDDDSAAAESMAPSPPADGGPLPVGVRQSGTTGRFLLPMLAATPGRFVLDGDQQLRERPFGPQIEALTGLGAVIEGQTLPLSIDGRALNAGRVEVASSISSQFFRSVDSQML